ncbi:hypothetical protein ANRL4_03788 [Anaerolineae bacterium]|nr:hypothetical protein ANRL4_03788 [Anaerolineae bacterium]
MNPHFHSTAAFLAHVTHIRMQLRAAHFWYHLERAKLETTKGRFERRRQFTRMVRVMFFRRALRQYLSYLQGGMQN